MRFRLTRFLAVSVISVQLLTALATGAWFYIAMRDATRDLALANIEAVFDEVIDQTVAYLQPIEQTAVAIGTLVEAGKLTFDINDETGTASDLEAYFLERMRENDQFAGVFVGRPDGSFYFTTRDIAGGLSAFRTKTITGSGSERESNSLWRKLDGTPVRSDSDPDDPYDPRTRSWYELAIQSDGPVWTAPYIFFTAQRPGITAATAVRNQAGEILAVVGIDIELNTLSRFLKATTASMDGTAMIMDGSGDVFAHSSRAAVHKDGEGDSAELRFLRVDELESAVGHAYATGGSDTLASLKSNDPTFVRVEDDGESYFVGLRRMAADNWPWIVAVEVREASFATAMRRNTWIGVVLALVLGSVGSIVGYTIARDIGGPLATLRDNAHKVVDGEKVRLEPVRSRFREVQETSIALWDIMSRLREQGDKGSEQSPN